MELSSFCNIAKIVSESTDRKELIRKAVNFIIDEFSFTASIAFLMNEECLLTKYYSRGIKSNLEELNSTSVCSLNSASFTCINSDDAIVTHDITNPEITSCLGREYFKAGFKTLVCLPLKVEKKMIGAIHLMSEKRMDISELDIQSLSAISEQLAIGIDKVWLYDELEKQKKFLENLIDSSISAIVTLDLKGIITLINSTTESILKYPKQEILGSPISKFMAGGEREALRFVNSIIENEKLYNYETTLKTMAGELVPMSVNTSLLKDKSGKVTGMLGIGTDLRNIASLESRLMEQEQYLANILSSSAEAIITLDENHIVRSWNRGAEMIFSYAEEEMLGKSFLPLVPDDLTPENELEDIADKLKKASYLRNYETERMTKDGKRIKVMVTATALYNEKGEFTGRSAFIRDITESKRMEETLIRAEKLAAIGELSASLAHEIKNPLAGIDGAISVISKKFDHDPLLLEIFEEIKRQINRLNSTMNNLLDYARPQEPSPKPCDINAILEKTMFFLKREPRMSNVRVIRKFRENLPLVVVDRDQIEQVFLNIILNALVAMKSKGSLEITSGMSDNSVFVSIKDNGVGIAPEVLGKIFDPFFTTKSKGTGIGLSISKNFIESNNGELHVESELNKGSTFTVSFPIWRN